MKRKTVWIVRWITLCANLHNFVIEQNDEWTAEDFGDDIPIANEERVHIPMHDPQRFHTRRATLAISTALLNEVMDHAISHHINAGTFAAMGRE